jgi:hypothetical protein
MMLFTRHLKLTVALVCGLALCAHGAQAPQHININQLSTTVEDVVVPLPNEIFGALNKLGAVSGFLIAGGQMVRRRCRREIAVSMNLQPTPEQQRDFENALKIGRVLASTVGTQRPL